MRAEDILQIAMEQSAEDIGCKVEDFMKNKNVVVPFRLGKNARKYLEEPIPANFVSYGNNVVASADKDIQEIVSEYVGKYEFYHLFESPNMHWLDDRLAGNGYRVCFMAEYYLPDISRLHAISCDYELQILDRRILKACICRNGAMPCAKNDSTWTCSVSGLMRMES